jgi:hypothetical protein
MRTESAQVMKRQWHIVRFLLNGQYVATRDLKTHLESVGITAELRTIQRDLRILKGIFPLECRINGMPRCWRWMRQQDNLA